VSLKSRAQVINGKGAVMDKATKARRQAGEAASRVAPVAASARVTARQGMRRARTWTAPRLERTGQALEKRVAPRISAMLGAAARRIEPPPKRRLWPFLTAGVVTAAAAAGAAIRMVTRRGAETTTQLGKAAEKEAPAQSESAAATKAADVNGRVRTS
jgi:hypothetical protein